MKLYILSYIEVASGKSITAGCYQTEEAARIAYQKAGSKQNKYSIECFRIEDNLLLYEVAKNLFNSRSDLFNFENVIRLKEK